MRRLMPGLSVKHFIAVCSLVVLAVIVSANGVQFSSMASGAGYSCTVSSGFGVRCWGFGGFGTLGNGNIASITSIPSYDILNDAVSMAVGADFACALTGDPELYPSAPLNASLRMYCWGSNSNGQLATSEGLDRCVTGDTGCALSPVGVSAGISSHSHVISSPASQHACILSADGGKVACWGSGACGQLGRGDVADFRGFPTDFVLSAVFSVATGWGHTCVIMLHTFGVRCWGHNGYGELGNGDSTGGLVVTPPLVDVLTNASRISCGAHFTCVIMHVTSGVRCWGGGYYGQLGNGRLDNLYSPPGDDVVTGVAALATGNSHVCVILLSTSGVRCWGNNDYGELGNGKADGLPSLRPPDTDVLDGARLIAAGSRSTCVIMLSTSGIRCWGSNEQGALGNGGGFNAMCGLGVPCCIVPPSTDNVVDGSVGNLPLHASTRTPSRTIAVAVAVVGGCLVVVLCFLWYRRGRRDHDVAPSPSIAANGQSRPSTGSVKQREDFRGVAPQVSDVVESVDLDRAVPRLAPPPGPPHQQLGEKEYKGNEYDIAMHRRAGNGSTASHQPDDEIVVSAKGVAQDDEVYVYVRWSLGHPEGCKGFVLLALVDGGPQMMERVPCHLGVTTYEKSLGPLDALDRTITLLLEAVPSEHSEGSLITQGSVFVESPLGRWLKAHHLGSDVHKAIVQQLKQRGVGIGSDLEGVLSFVWAEGHSDWDLSPDAQLKLQIALAEYFRSSEGVAQSAPQ